MFNFAFDKKTGIIMNTAETTALTVYRNCNLGALPQDVKRHLMILMLSDTPYAEEDEPETASLCESPEPMTPTQLHARIDEALMDIKEGRVSDPNDMEHRLETQYPWLCK